MNTSIVIISKDEAELDLTLNCLQETYAPDLFEIVVVDSSLGRLNWIHEKHPEVNWHDFKVGRGIKTSIPHQRNFGIEKSKGDVVIFLDAGCVPRSGWLGSLLHPMNEDGELVTTGIMVSVDDVDIYDRPQRMKTTYVEECATATLAVKREVFESIGSFDERFAYGSDVDFTWRVREGGIKIRIVSDAVVEHNWGGFKRRLRRSYVYGIARARIYNKHRDRVANVWRDNPMVVAYPLFIVGLPLTIRFHWYPLLVAIPLWRNRSTHPVHTLIDHLAYGAGTLRELGRIAIRRT